MGWPGCPGRRAPQKVKLPGLRRHFVQSLLHLRPALRLHPEAQGVRPAGHDLRDLPLFGGSGHLMIQLLDLAAEYLGGFPLGLVCCSGSSGRLALR